MTLGADGALIAGPDGLTKIASYPVDVVDTTGAGDASTGHSLQGWPVDWTSLTPFVAALRRAPSQ